MRNRMTSASPSIILIFMLQYLIFTCLQLSCLPTDSRRKCFFSPSFFGLSQLVIVLNAFFKSIYFSRSGTWQFLCITINHVYKAYIFFCKSVFHKASRIPIDYFILVFFCFLGHISSPYFIENNRLISLQFFKYYRDF